MKTTLDLMLEHRPELLSLDVAQRSRNAIAFSRHGRIVHAALSTGRLHGWGDGGFMPLDILPRRVGGDIVVPHSPYRVGPGGEIRWAGRLQHLPVGMGVVRGADYRRIAPVSRRPLLADDRIIRAAGSQAEYVTQLHAEGFSDHLILHEAPQVDGDYLAIEYRRTAPAPEKGCAEALPFARDADGRRIICDLIRRPGMLLVAVPISWLAAARYPVDIDPDFTFCLTCFCQGSSASYAAARATCLSALSSCTDSRMGQVIGGITYVVARHSFLFPAPCFQGTITGVTMDLAVQSVTERVTEFDIHIADSDFYLDYGGPQVAHGTKCGFACTVCEPIWDRCGTCATDVVWRNTTGIVVDTYYTSPAMSVAYAQQNLDDTGSFWYCVRSAEDFAASAPTANEAVDLYCCGSAAFKPILHITGDLICGQPQTHLIPYGV